MLSAHRVLDALRGDDYDDDGENLDADTRRQVREALHAAVLRSAALEQVAAPQPSVSDGAVMAMELNAYGATADHPTREMEVEPMARLAETEAERRTVWVDAQGVVQSTEACTRRLGQVPLLPVHLCRQRYGSECGCLEAGGESGTCVHR